VRSGQRLSGLYTAYLVDGGDRWIVVGSGGFEARGPWLAYSSARIL